MSQPSPPRRVRRQLFVARKAQGRLLFRVMMYCVVTATATTAISLTLALGGASAWWLAIAAPIALLCVVPLVLVDAARASNRLVGPFVRVQGAIRGLANGDPVAPLEARGPDDWQEWIQEFNIMLSRIQPGREPVRATYEEGSASR